MITKAATQLHLILTFLPYLLQILEEKQRDERNERNVHGIAVKGGDSE